MFTGTALTIAFISTRLGVKMPWARQGLSQEERFKIWLMELAEQSDESLSQKIASDLKAWIEQLSEQESKALVKKLALYCQASGIELEWLLSEQPLNEKLRHATQEIVLFYLLSCMKGTQIKEEAQLFKAYQAFNKNPKKHLVFGQHFYEALLHKRLVPEPERGPLKITKRSDRKKMMKQMRQAAIDQPVAFHVLLKIVGEEIEAKRLT